MDIKLLNSPPVQGTPSHTTEIGPAGIGPAVVKKGWGHEVWIVNSPKYCLKVLHFGTDKRFSFHYHLIKEETWLVNSGLFQLLVSDKQGAQTIFTLEPGSVYHVLPGVPHQIVCLQEGDIIEVSTTHDEGDSWRIEKGD